MKRTLKFALIALLCLLFCSLGMVACGPQPDGGKTDNPDNGGGKTENEDNGGGKTDDENYGDISYVGDWGNGDKLPGREKISASNITEEQVKAWFKPYVDAINEIAKDEIITLTEDNVKILTETFKAAGVTNEQLTSLNAKTKDGINVIKDTVLTIIKSDKFDINIITADKIKKVFDATKAIFDIIKPEQMQAIGAGFVKKAFAPDEVRIEYRTSNKDANKSISDAKKFFGNNYKYVESLLFTDNTMLRMANSTISSDSATYTLKGIINGMKALLNLDAKKYENIAKIVYAFASSDNIEEMLSGKGSLSYKQIVDAVNYVGQALNAFIGGFGNVVEFEKNANEAYHGFLKSQGAGEGEGEYFDIFGVCGILKTAADILQNLKPDFVAGVYMDYDDYAKATTEAEQQEKIGYIVAKVGNYVNKHYKLNEKSEQFVNNVLKVIDGRRSVNFVEVKSLMKKCSAKSAEDTTAQERTEYATQLKKLIETKEHGLRVYVYWNCFVPVGADKETVKKELNYDCDYRGNAEALDSNGDYNGDDEVAGDESNGEGFDASQVTVSCDTSKEGFCDVIFEYKGEKVIIKSVVYAYDKTSASKFVIATSEKIKGISVSKNETITNDQIIDDLQMGCKAYHKDTAKSEHIDWSYLTEYSEKSEVIGFSQNNVGEHNGLVKFVKHKVFGDVYIPFVYYVYDPNGTAKETNISIEIKDRVLKGEDIKGKIILEYNYDINNCSKEYSFDDDAITIKGFDKNKLGKQKIKIIAKLDGKERTFDETVKVITIGRATGYANLETYININQAIDEVSVYVDIYLYDADGDYYVENVWGTMTIAELRTRMARYGFELKHDIDASVVGEREGKIWLEKDGKEACELFSGNVIVLFAESVVGDVDLQHSLNFDFGEDIDAIPVNADIVFFYENIWLDQIVETMTIAELRTRMARYGFELKHDIDTSVGGAREGKIWLEKDGQKVCVLFSETYSVNVTEDTEVSVKFVYTFTGGQGFLGEEDGVYFFAVGSDVNQMTMTIKGDFFVNGVSQQEETLDNTTIAEINEQSEGGEKINHNIYTQVASDEVKEGEFWFEKNQEKLTDEELKEIFDGEVIHQKIKYKVVETTPAEQ